MTVEPVNSDGGALRRLFEGAANSEYERARRTVASARRRRPEALTDEVVREVCGDFVRDMTVLGASAGAAAAVPGPGQIVRIAVGTTAETAFLMSRAAHMIFAVASAHGYELDDVEVRKYVIIRVLGVWAGATDALGVVAGQVVQGLGKKAVQRIPMSVIHSINGAVGKRVLVKWGAKTGAIRLGSVAPFGIGAALGGGGNHLMARGLVKATIAECRPGSGHLAVQLSG